MSHMWIWSAAADSGAGAYGKGHRMPEVLDRAASVDRAATDSKRKRKEAPCSAPSPPSLSFSNPLLHLGDLAVDALDLQSGGLTWVSERWCR